MTFQKVKFLNTQNPLNSDQHAHLHRPQAPHAGQISH